jgi:hypothetical protein
MRANIRAETIRCHYLNFVTFEDSIQQGTNVHKVIKCLLPFFKINEYINITTFGFFFADIRSKKANFIDSETLY